VGGGEHARVVAEAVRSRPDQWTLLGFVDPNRSEETSIRLRLSRLGADEWLLEHLGPGVVLGIGATESPSVRRGLVTRLGVADERWVPVVHSHAWVSPTAEVESGAVIMAGAVVQSGARLGRHVLVNTGAVVEHDVTVGDFAQVGPGVTIGGGASVGADALVGLGARVRDHISIGSGALVGMGSVVVSDIPAGARVVGVPAKPNPKRR
jgi:acetyltransferase EpsM